MTKNEATQTFKQFRQRFLIHNPDVVYLDGNSLGRLPLQTLNTIQEVVENQWGRGLIGSWNQHWLKMVQRVRQKIATLIGAHVDEVLVADSTSINLFKLVYASLEATSRGTDVVTDNANFPSDLYILQGLCERSRRPAKLKIIDVTNKPPEQVLDVVLQQISDDTKLVVLSHVHYQSGYAYSMEDVNREAARKGVRVIWDVSHSVGAMPIDVRADGCDMLVGCCYKYLNGGPGAPAFLYIRRELQSMLHNPIQGWFGAREPFSFSEVYEPMPGIEQFAVGTPNVLSLAAIEPGVDLVLEVGTDRIRQRSIELTERLISEVDVLERDFGILVVTPKSAKHRGSHVSVQHPNAWQITQALIQDFKVIPDYREPNMIRFGITPLYTDESEIDRAVQALAIILREQLYSKYSIERRGVT